MARKWEVVDDGDRDFIGSYDVWIEEPDEDGEGGQIIAACFRSEALLIAAAPSGYALAQKVAGLNPDAGEIGEGMLRTIVDMARRVVAEVEGMPS